ncbi:MAG TPA: GNAT family N-acetyltransferase [Candidatus Limnocylindria bacterium]|nr:GNAT family N-acetyltransferase [Candidatus Limnocylindria bacterium]
MAIVVRPITARRFKDVEALFATDSIMRSCWDMWPRYGSAERRVLQARYPHRSWGEVNRAELRKLAARPRAPGLLAYDGKEAVGFVSLGPREEIRRLDASRATPRVDDIPVWVIPCFFVRKDRRGQGVTVELLKAAVAYAKRHGAPAVEGYPRAPGTRVHDTAAFFGSVPQFRRAGFRKVAGPRADLPKGWVPRYTMRAECRPTTSATSRPSRPRSRSAAS